MNEQISIEKASAQARTKSSPEQKPENLDGIDIEPILKKAKDDAHQAGTGIGVESKHSPEHDDSSYNNVDFQKSQELYENLITLWPKWNPGQDVAKQDIDRVKKYYLALQTAFKNDLRFPDFSEYDDLDRGTILENSFRNLNSFVQKYEVLSPLENGVFQQDTPIQFKSLESGAVFAATPDKITYLGEAKYFSPLIARQMIQNFTMRDDSMISGEKINLNGCNPRQQALLLLAIAEYNDRAPEDKRINAGLFKKPLPFTAARAEWKEFQRQNPLPGAERNKSFSIDNDLPVLDEIIDPVEQEAQPEAKASNDDDDIPTLTEVITDIEQDIPAPNDGDGIPTLTEVHKNNAADKDAQAPEEKNTPTSDNNDRSPVHSLDRNHIENQFNALIKESQGDEATQKDLEEIKQNFYKLTTAEVTAKVIDCIKFAKSDGKIHVNITNNYNRTMFGLALSEFNKSNGTEYSFASSDDVPLTNKDAHSDWKAFKAPPTKARTPNSP